VGAALTVNAKLELGEVSQVVEVTASALIESTQPNPDALIGVRAIEELPINGRRFHDFVSLAPTVQIEPQRSGISFAGQRGINSIVTIDGADYTEPFFGGIRGGERANNAFTIPQEAISQFQVVSYGYSVEFGRSTGGIMNATTKSGANDLHGSAFFVARNGELAANDALNHAAVTNLYEEGGSLGGRIHRDKAFFFAAFENQKNDIPHQILFPKLDGVTPGPAQIEAFCFYRLSSLCPQGATGQEGPFTQTNDALSGFGRLDFQPNVNHRFGVSYHYSRNTGDNANATGNLIQPQTNVALSANGAEGDRTNTVVGQWTAIFSPRLIMETRGQYSLENRPRLANTQQANITSTIGITGTRSFLPTTLDDYRVQIASNLTWTYGTHAVKFGGEFNFIHMFQFFKFNQFGVYNINPTDALTILGIMGKNPNRFDTGQVSYRVNIGNGLLDANLKQIAFFIQDTWRITPRVTLTAGFRWEGYVNPQPDVSNAALYNLVKNSPFPVGKTVDPAFIPSNYRQYMPRLGIAWDPRGNAKTVIRANAGLFYAPTPLLLYANSLNAFRATPGDLSVVLPLAVPSGFNCSAVALYATDKCNTIYSQLLHIGTDLNTFTLDKIPTITPAQVSQIAAFLGLTPKPFTGAAPFATANNYEMPRSWQWSVGLEHELARGFSVGADFVYISTVHLQRNFDLNLPPPVTCTAVGPVAGTNATCNAVDLSLRPCFGVTGGSVCSSRRPRPISSLSNYTLRESTARSLYRGFTVRTNYRRSRVQFQAYYTLSYNYSTDDNERSATGYNYDNPFNLAPEYGFSRIDARHLFLFNGLVDLPFGFTVSALGRFRSGRTVDPVIGFIANGAESPGFSFGDRAFKEAGVPFQRNSFRDRSTQDVDLRVAKKFHLPREGMSLSIAADFFNLFNFANVVYNGGSEGISGINREFGLGVDPATGKPLSPNARFRRLFNNPGSCLSVNPNGNPSCYDTNDFAGGNGTIPPFTVQLGIRFQF
jgi:hypothetical protein